jgi:hypothetical protein
MIKLLMTLLLLPALASTAGAVDESGAGEKNALDTLARSAAVANALQHESGIPEELAHPDGCYIWQQPGVALSVTGVTGGPDEPVLYYDAAKQSALLDNLPAYQSGNPFIHPPEPADGEFFIEPQVWLLDATESRSRLAEYLQGYSYWIELNPEGSFIVPDAVSLETDAALVFIDSGGPAEFHFQRDDSGELKLRHVFIWDYFSA